MASPQQTELAYAWEKYMDCRLQGADLQVGAGAGVIQAQLRLCLSAYFSFPGLQGSAPGNKLRFRESYMEDLQYVYVYLVCLDGVIVFVFIIFKLQNLLYIIHK